MVTTCSQLGRDGGDDDDGVDDDDDGVDGDDGVERLWKRIGDIVIRTLLCADNRLRNKFSARKSMYNCYNLTGASLSF